MKRVIIESPYSGNDKSVLGNIAYAAACMRDSLMKGEAPFVSHLLYTQLGILDDTNSDERRRGIEAGLCWGRCADLTAVYIDYGITPGMQEGIDRAIEEGRKIEERAILK